MPIAHYPALLETLLQPQAYPEQVSAVDLVESHISFLFLTGEHVYKMKKPVDYGFLDFTTLEKRHYYYHQEVELNRRISPGVYIGVVEVKERGGMYSFHGPGRTVDYAVKMRQLPRDRAMNALLERDQVSEEDVRRLAAKIADFHRRADTGAEVAEKGGMEAVRLNIEENFSQTEKFIGICLSQDTFDDLVAYSHAFLDAQKDVFLRRAADGRLRDCHGDLHTAQIFLEPHSFTAPNEGTGSATGEGEPDGISIIDCIEFNDRFRYSDVAEDIAFLAMDLDFHGRPDLSRLFVQAYVQESGDGGVLELLDFFKSYRAYVRGKVNCFRLDDPLLSGEDREQAKNTAETYFRLAHSYSRIFHGPVLILVAGITGTGKSTVAQELARRWGFAYISSDITRKRLAGIGPGEHRYVPFGEGLYSWEYSRHTYDSMLHQTDRDLRMGRSVVLDATFRRSEDGPEQWLWLNRPAPIRGWWNVRFQRKKQGTVWRYAFEKAGQLPTAVGSCTASSKGSGSRWPRCPPTGLSGSVQGHLQETR